MMPRREGKSPALGLSVSLAFTIFAHLFPLCTCAEPGSKRAKNGPPVGMPIIGQAGSAATSERAVPAKRPAGQKNKKCSPKTQLEELPYRRADGKWTCTFSTGGMNKDR